MKSTLTKSHLIPKELLELLSCYCENWYNSKAIFSLGGIKWIWWNLDSNTKFIQWHKCKKSWKNIGKSFLEGWTFKLDTLRASIFSIFLEIRIQIFSNPKLTNPVPNPNSNYTIKNYVKSSVSTWNCALTEKSAPILQSNQLILL